MTEKTYISEKLRFLEGKIKRLEEKSKYRSWQIQVTRTIIENKKNSLERRSSKLAAIRAEICQKEQELKKACTATQTENIYKNPNVALLKNKILKLKSRLKAVDKASEKLSDEIEFYKKELKELTNYVDDEVLYHYKRLSDSKDGNPITHVIGNVCSGCLLNITLQTLNALKANEELVLCPSCKRILFLSEDYRI